MLGFTGSRTIIRISDQPNPARISIILPVLNEAARVTGALDTLAKQPEEVAEILVVDGGSTDETRQIVARCGERDHRIKLLDASPVDPRWTGKVWGLHYGLARADTKSDWILCIDADVQAAPQLARSLLAHAQRTGLKVFSVATRQRLAGSIDGLLHPAMLTTLIYRFGAPGGATANRHRVQANGQCFFARRETLVRTEAFQAARASLCEDITIVRRLAECGEQVGFYESEAPVEASMYAHGRETWNNWPRSLAMRDQYFGWREALGLLGVILFQALPLPLFICAWLFDLPAWILSSAGLLMMIRLGVLLGAARAYPNRPWTYWLSPLADLPVALRIVQFALRRRHTWRGRTYVRVRGGAFELSGAANRLP